jgi:hypothetical protein
VYLKIATIGAANFGRAPEDLWMEMLPIVRVTSLTAAGSLLQSLGNP